jgi:hypothetical protein
VTAADDSTFTNQVNNLHGERTRLISADLSLLPRPRGFVLLILADRGAEEDNGYDALQTVYPFPTYVEPVCARAKGSVPQHSKTQKYEMPQGLK